MTSDPKREAESLRDLARRARRLAMTQGQRQDVERLERYAEELEIRASELEKEAAPAGGLQPVTHDQQQVQQQQQQEAEPPLDRSKPK